MYRSTRQCPVCGDKFEIHRTKNYSYERCEGCLGVWIDLGVLEELVAEVAPELEFELETTAVGSRPRRCPDCQVTMGRFEFARIPLDACLDDRHGIWFDKDELTYVLDRAADDDAGPPPPPTSMTSLLSDFFRAKGGS
ncbi:MAG: zf-TFIIB domain-containing protein [Deltaproteobacteria bacterium]|nr:zf-TFIIB domain-containing protein [Deltaproteobacteria bacterium]